MLVEELVEELADELADDIADDSDDDTVDDTTDEESPLEYNNNASLFSIRLVRVLLGFTLSQSIRSTMSQPLESSIASDPVLVPLCNSRSCVSKNIFMCLAFM